MALRGNLNQNTESLGSGSGAPGALTPVVLPTLEITALKQNGDSVSNNSIVAQESDGSFQDITFIFTWSEQIKGFAGFNIYYRTDEDSPSNAGGFFTTLNPDSGTGLVFTSTFTAKANSAGTVTIEVPRRSVEATDEPAGRFGPTRGVAFTVYYDNTEHIEASIIPIVEITTPAEVPYSATTFPIEFDWNVPLIRNTFLLEVNPMSMPVANATTSASSIQITDTNTTTPAVVNLTGLEAVPDESNTYYPTVVDNNVARYTINLTLSGSGTVTVSVPGGSIESTAGVGGPVNDESVSFTYNTTSAAVNTTITGTGQTVIYDSGDVAFNTTGDLLANPEQVAQEVSVGGAYKGVSDLVKIGNDLYGTLQIQQQSATMNQLNESAQARAVLFKIRAAASSTPMPIKRYIGITEAARSITERNNDIWFFEGSPYADYFSIPRETNDWRERVGYVRSITRSSTIVRDRGLNWRSKLIDLETRVPYDNTVYGIHRGTTAPMLSIDDNFYLFSSFGDLRYISSPSFITTQITENEAQPVTFIDNLQLIRLGDELLFNLPILETNDRTGFEIINQMASLALCYIGFDSNGQFFMKPKFPIKSDLGSSGSGMYNASVTTITDRNRQREFPISGTLMINNELINYTERTNTQFTGLIRGSYGTAATSHNYDSDVYYIDHIIDMTENYLAKPINELRLRSDSSQLYNQIRLKYANDEKEVFVEDEMSINENKGRELELQLPLDRHQGEWVEWLAEKYLEQYGKLNYLAEIQLKPTFHWNIGETVAIREPMRSNFNNYKLFQIIRITQNPQNKTTNIQIRTLN